MACQDILKCSLNQLLILLVIAHLLIVANSTMAISRLSSYLNSQDISSKSALSVWVITCNPAANTLPLEPAKVLFYKLILHLSRNVILIQV